MSRSLLFSAEPRLPDRLVERLASHEVSILSDAMSRMNGLVGILPINPGAPRRLAGRALTVRVAPGDNIGLYKAFDVVEPGDVIVIDAGGHVDRAIFGEILVRYAMSIGVGGIVIDGAVRDITALQSLAIPIFARGISHLGPFKNGPAEVRGVISVGSCPILNGDIIIGDADGVVRIPSGDAEAVADTADTIVSAEAAAMRDIERGTYDPKAISSAVATIEHE